MQQASNSRPSIALSVGQRLELSVGRRHDRPLADAGDGESDWLPSRVEDFDPRRQRLTVAWPTDAQRQYLVVESGQTVEVSASTAQDAHYAAAAVVEQTHGEPLPLLVLSLSGAWRRTQRRQAFRVEVAIRPRLANKVMGDAFKTLRLGINDLSATGLQVRSRDALAVGDALLLAFELMGSPEEVIVQARVARVQRLSRGGIGHTIWEAGCQFEGLSERLTQRIVQYIFAQQRRLVRAKKDNS